MTQNETIENKRKRLIFRSEHRGTKEMDLLMGSFAKKYIHEFNAEQLSWYDDLIENNDPDLYNWIIGKEPEPRDIAGELFDTLKAHRYA